MLDSLQEIDITKPQNRFLVIENFFANPVFFDNFDDFTINKLKWFDFDKVKTPSFRGQFEGTDNEIGLSRIKFSFLPYNVKGFPNYMFMRLFFMGPTTKVTPSVISLIVAPFLPCDFSKESTQVKILPVAPGKLTVLDIQIETPYLTPELSAREYMYTLLSFISPKYRPVKSSVTPLVKPSVKKGKLQSIYDLKEVKEEQRKRVEDLNEKESYEIEEKKHEYDVKQKLSEIPSSEKVSIISFQFIEGNIRSDIPFAQQLLPLRIIARFETGEYKINDYNNLKNSNFLGYSKHKHVPPITGIKLVKASLKIPASQIRPFASFGALALSIIFGVLTTILSFTLFPLSGVLDYVLLIFGGLLLGGATIGLFIFSLTNLYDAIAKIRKNIHYKSMFNKICPDELLTDYISRQ